MNAILSQTFQTLQVEDRNGTTTMPISGPCWDICSGTIKYNFLLQLMTSYQFNSNTPAMSISGLWRDGRIDHREGTLSLKHHQSCNNRSTYHSLLSGGVRSESYGLATLRSERSSIYQILIRVTSMQVSYVCLLI